MALNIRTLTLISIVSAVCAELARPTQDQIQWNALELGGIIHFNIGTYVSESDGCTENTPALPAIDLFNPTKLDIEQWAQALKVYGARYAVLVAKHACGFALWPTKVAFPEFNFTYDYSIAKSPFQGTNDIVRDFVDIMRKYDIEPGFYYTVSTNFYLNVIGNKVQDSALKPGQVRVTQEQYNMIALAQLTELWSQYGDLVEVWFDGGFPKAMAPQLTNMFAAYQPHAVALQGQNTTKNGIRWIGTEIRTPKGPIWSVTDSNFTTSDPDGAFWYPPECETTLQNQDHWFYKNSTGLRPLDKMLEIYHDTVGDNCNMLLDFSPNTSGLIPTPYIDAYRQLGNFIRACYSGQPTIKTYGSGGTLEATVDVPVRVDRYVIEEAIELGQRVLGYSVDAYLRSIGWQTVFTGVGIGHKRIIVLDAADDITAIRLRVTSTLGYPVIHSFAGYDCSALL